ncbi:hypothetical protein [Sinorhizobium fredii]|uniref:Uncharacterized protein n=1 Tax=Rhizobium fredii TaxID=380 RepID=A0A844AA60_RHIFR|nr:hypothetical protein [Sinorhizobium fredii]MQX09221.1 hypothetical protein [Sinorhizobium fredii]
MAHPTGMQQAFRINGLPLLTCPNRLIVSQWVFGKSPNLEGTRQKEKAAATGIAHGFGISTQNIHSVSSPSLQEVAA